MKSTAIASHHSQSLAQLAQKIKSWSFELGFQQVGVCDINLSQAEGRFNQWLKKGFHGEMAYMQRHGDKRSQPQKLVPGTKRAIVVRLDYLPDNPQFTYLGNRETGYISRYAQDKDYHKLIRKRLEKLAKRIEQEVGAFEYRAFTDSAPVMEKPLASKAGLGWQGKHTNLINPKAGSWFFLGVLYVNLELPIDSAFVTTHCGSCSACIDICPTKAIIAPYQLDARRCISYLTIELKGSIPIEFRQAIGNRIYGCDDCQIVCPWNKFAKHSQELGFQANRGLLDQDLVDLFLWTEQEFLKNTEGSAIRRIGYERWMRNIAVALGNMPSSGRVIQTLKTQKETSSPLIKEHVLWALNQHRQTQIDSQVADNESL